jgi:hypothetical protein
MSTTATDPHDRLPTTGPAQLPYEQYRFTITTDGNGLVYHADDDEQWIESETVLTLDDWR